MAPSLWLHYALLLLVVELIKAKIFLIKNKYIIDLNLKLAIIINIVNGKK